MDSSTLLVAAFHDGEDRVCALHGEGTLEVYQKHGSRWISVKTIPWDLSQAKTLDHLHQITAQTAQALGDCKILLCSDRSGPVKAILESYQIQFWLSGEPVMWALDKVVNYLEDSQANFKPTLEPPPPAFDFPADASGDVWVDLVHILREHPQVHSKNLLIPLLRAKNFRRLKITCEWIPCWLEKEATGLGFKIITHEKKNQGKECFEIMVN